MQDGHTAVYKASYYGHSAVVDTLLKAKAQVDVQNKVSKINGLWYFIRGHLQIVRIWLVGIGKKYAFTVTLIMSDD